MAQNDLGQIDVRRAQILAAGAKHELGAALARDAVERLRGVRASIHANWWSNETYIAGHITLADCHLALGDIDAAARVAEQLATQNDGDAEALLAAASLYGTCANQRAQAHDKHGRDWQQEVAHDVDAAIGALRRAVTCGAPDRRRLDDPAFAHVRQHKDFAVILNQLPPATPAPIRAR